MKMPSTRIHCNGKLTASQHTTKHLLIMVWGKKQQKNNRYPISSMTAFRRLTLWNNSTINRSKIQFKHMTFNTALPLFYFILNKHESGYFHYGEIWKGAYKKHWWVMALSKLETPLGRKGTKNDINGIQKKIYWMCEIRGHKICNWWYFLEGFTRMGKLVKSIRTRWKGVQKS